MGRRRPPTSFSSPPPPPAPSLSLPRRRPPVCGGLLLMAAPFSNLGVATVSSGRSRSERHKLEVASSRWQRRPPPHCTQCAAAHPPLAVILLLMAVLFSNPKGGHCELLTPRALGGLLLTSAPLSGPTRSQGGLLPLAAVAPFRRAATSTSRRTVAMARPPIGSVILLSTPFSNLCSCDELICDLDPWWILCDLDLWWIF